MKLIDSRTQQIVHGMCWARACALANDRVRPIEKPVNNEVEKSTVHLNFIS